LNYHAYSARKTLESNTNTIWQILA